MSAIADGERRQWHAGDSIAVAMLGIVAASGSLLNAYTGDDHWIVEHNDRVHHVAAVWRLFGQTYWPPQNGAALYRPIPMVAFALEWAAGHGAPWVVHASGMLLYALVIVAVGCAARLVLPRRGAWLVAALFAVQPIHAEVTSNAVGQAEIWSALWAVIGVIIYVRWRRDGAPWSTARLITLATVYGAACLSKESGITLPLLIAAAETTVVAEPVPKRRPAFVPPWPVVIVLAVTGLLYVGVRWSVVGSLAGDYPTFVFAHAPLHTRWLTMLGAAPTVAQLLFAPGRIAVEYMPQAIVLRSAPDLGLVPALLLLAGGAAIAWRVRTAWPVITFGLLWIALTLIPVSNLLLPAGVLLAPRTLFLPSVGAALVTGTVLEAMWNALLARETREIASVQTRVHRRRVVLAAATTLAVLGYGLWRSVHRAGAWRNDFALVAHTVADAPSSYLAHDAYGHALLELGQNDQAHRELERAIALYDGDPGPYVHLALADERMGRCDASIPSFRRALAILASRPDARLGLVRCLSQTGHYDSAMTEARTGLAYGYSAAAFRQAVAQARQGALESRK